MTGRDVKPRRRLRVSAAAATAVGGLVPLAPAWADTITLNNGDLKTYTPAQANTATGVTVRVKTAGINGETSTFDWNAAGAPAVATSISRANNATVEARQFIGKLEVLTGGSYTFFASSDDGARIFVDGSLIVNNDGGHGTVELSRSVTLDAGLHDLRVDWVNSGGNGSLTTSYQGPDQATKAAIPQARLRQAENAGSATAVADNITFQSTTSGTDDVVLAAGAAATINVAGTNYAVAGLGALDVGAGSTLNVTGTATLQNRDLRFTGAVTLNGSATFNTPTEDLAFGGQVTQAGAAGPYTIVKQGAGRLTLDNTPAGAAAANALANTTFEVQGGTLFAVLGNTTTFPGATNPLGAAAVTLNGGTLGLDTKGGDVTVANAITVPAGASGTVEAMPGQRVFTLSNAAGPAVGANSTLTFNTGGGSNNAAATGGVVGAIVSVTGPLTGSGALVKTGTNLGSTFAAQANRGGTVILNGDSQSFSGPVTVTAEGGVLDGRAAAAAAKPFGTGPITLDGGQLNFRGSNGSTVTYALNQNVTIGGNTVLDVAKTGGADNSIVQFGTLSVAANAAVTVQGGNGYSATFGATTLAGDPSFTNTVSLTLGALDDGGTPRTLGKAGTGLFTLNQAAAGFTGAINLSAGQTNVSAANAVGSGLVTVSNALTQLNLSATNSNAEYDVTSANAILSGNAAGFTGLTRVAAAPSAAGQVRLAAGAVVAETAAGVNDDIAALGTDRDLVFGIAANLADSVTVGATFGATPWRGVSNDRTARSWTGGTITALSNFTLQGTNATNLTFTGGTVSSADAVVGTIALGRIVLNAGNLGLTTATTRLTFGVPGGSALQLGGLANAMGNNANGDNNAAAVAYAGGVVDPGAAANSMSGNVHLQSGAVLTLNDANNLGGVGRLTAEPGAILDLSNATALANGNANQSATLLPAGVVVRLGVNATNLDTTTNPASNFVVSGGNRANTVLLSAAAPPRAGFESAVLTQDATLSGTTPVARTATGAVQIGAGGGTLAAPATYTFNVNAPISVAPGTTGGRPLTVGTNLVVDPGQVNAPRTGTVVLQAANDYGTGADVINQVNLRGRATLVGTPSGNGNLPQGAGVGLDLGGILQVNGPAAGATMDFGQVTANGGTLYLNRNAAPTAGLVANLNAPLSRSATFGPGGRGSLTLQLTAGQVLGTSTDKVTFANAADAPSRITVTGTGGDTQINMLPPWLVATGSTAPSADTTFLDAPDPTGAGLVPVTYVAMPATGGAGTEIAQVTANTAITGNVTVAALRTGANVSGAFTVNITSGGLLMRGSAGATTFSSGINFGTAEGVIGNVQSSQANIISGRISGTGGVMKFGGNSLHFNNATNDFTGGLTITEGNLRPGAASTATASPFGYTAAAGFNVVTVNTAGTLDMNAFDTRVGGLQGTGLVTNAPTTGGRVLTLDVRAAAPLTFAGTIQDGGASTGITKVGSGSQILAGTLAYTGPTTITEGSVLVEGVSTRVSAFTVNTGATLGGSGIITGAVTVNAGGNLAPGSSPGVLRTGALTLTAGSDYEVELAGPALGDGTTGYDQVEVVGTVAVGGANLVPTLTYAPSAGDALYVVNNDGFDAVTGLFSFGGSPVPQGGTIDLVSTADGFTYPFTVSYTGEFFRGGTTTTGNDVVLISQVPEPASLAAVALATGGLLARRRRRG